MKLLSILVPVLMIVGGVILLVMAMGRSAEPLAASPAPIEPEAAAPGVHARNLPEDAPKFRTEYRGPLAQGWSISMGYEQRYSLMDRERKTFGGYATGPNGESVFVSPAYPAHAAELPSEIRTALHKFFADVARLEKNRETPDASFTDRNGETWIKSIPSANARPPT